VSGSMLAILGEGNYPLGARAKPIRDGLFAKDTFSASDLMDIQLEDRALFLDRWQKLAMATLNENTLAENPSLQEARGLIADWGGRAAVRRALYLAAFVGPRSDPALKTFRQRLEAAGKPFKVAIVACARKLLTILNALIRDDKDYRSA